MNSIILDMAAEYVNRYRSKCEQLGEPVDKSLLRGHITRLFGAVYAALLVV